MLDAVLALNGLDTRVFDTSSVATAPHEASDYITVPDAHLLFNGEFTRVGTSDLKIVGSDGKSFFIENYFSAENHKHLMSPEGALLTADLVDALSGPLAPGQHAQAGAQPAAAQAVIGRVDAASGSCTVVRNGVSVALSVGDTVRKGDVVVTSSASAVAIVFTDGTTFSLSANARMVLNEFVYNAGGSNNGAVISLVQGTFSFVAGQVAKTGDMKVETPVATMGIRGTAVLVEISANDGQTKFSVMVEPNGTTGSFNLYNKTTGALIGTVNSSTIGWVVTPAGPLQVLAQQVDKTPAELQQELGIVQQLFTIFNNFQQNPIQQEDPNKRGDDPNSNQQTAQGSGGGSGTPFNNAPLPNQQTNVTVTITKIDSNAPQLGGAVQNGNTNTGGVTGSGSGTGAGGGVTAPLPTGTFTLINGSGVILGTPGDDHIFGSDGADTITALAGNDQVFAGGGDDVIIAGEGAGNDFYDGGAGFDTIKFESANGVVFNLNAGTRTLSTGEVVSYSTADGPLTGHDEFIHIEKIVGSPGNDVFVINQLVNWEIDGGAGVDIVRIAGALDLTAASGGPVATNIEILDLNQNFANAAQFNAADIVAANSSGLLRVLGGTTDVVSLTSTYQVGGQGPLHIGTWQLVGTIVDPSTDNGQGDPFNDHVTDGVTFDVYQFVSDGQVVSTIYVQDGVQINVVAGQTSAVNDAAPMTENEAIAVDVVANDAPGFDTTRTLTSVGSATISGPAGVSLGSPQIAIVDNELSIVPGTAFDALGEGQTATITVPYTMQIGSGQTLNAVATITVTGTNDAPFFSSLDGYSRTATEDGGPVTFNLLANAADKDAPDTLSAINIASSGVDGGGQTVDVSGAVSVVGSNVTIDPAFFNSLGVGESVTVTVNYDLSDGHTTTHNTATLVVTGANDGPYFSSLDGFDRTASEDDAAVTFNLLNHAVDPDGDALSVVNVATSAVNGQGGAVDVSEAVSVVGNDVTIDPDFFNSLAVNQTVTITVNYDVSDGQTTIHNTATLLVTGANDAPVITAAISTGTVNAGADPSLNPVAAGYLTADHDLVTNLGGDSGFGENSLAPNDDGSTGAVDITSVFGEDGLNFFGTHYTSIYINNNGNITFGSPTGQFTPSEISGGAGNPIIAPFWADVDTRSGAGATTPGGDSTGSNLVYYDLDTEHGVVTITWDDVGYFSEHDDKQNAFQLQLIDRGNGDFDIVFRYEDVNWTTGDASNGSGGLGGTPARAGYSAGDGLPTHYYELTGSGDQAMMLALEQMEGNTGIPGVYVFHVRNGDVSQSTATGTIEFDDVDTADTHSVSTAFNATATGSSQALGILTAELSHDTSGGTDGIVTWNYVVSPEVLNSLSPGPHVEVFDVTVSDGNGGTVTQQVTITLNGPEGPSNDRPVLNEAASPALLSVDQDAGAPVNGTAVGTLVSDLVDLSSTEGGLNNVTDADAGAVTGMAIYINNAAHGDLYYSTDGGTTWSLVGEVSDSAALLLAADGQTRLYFQPDAGFNGSLEDIFTFRAWDQTEGTNGGHFDIGAGGTNTNSVSSAPDHVGITVDASPANATPVANAVNVSGDEDASSIIVTLTGSDTDGSVTGFQLLSLPTDGWLYTDLSSSPLDLDDLDNILSAYSNSRTLYFKPAADWDGETHFQFVAIDDHNAPSADPATATITVHAVNDAPVASDIGVSTSADNFSIPVTLSGSDIDGTIKQFALSTLPEHGTLYVDADHESPVVLEATYTADPNGHVTFYFVPDPEWPLETSFDFITYDDLGTPSDGPGHVTITADPVNVAPEISFDAVTVSEGEDTTTVHGVSVTDPDAAPDEIFHVTVTAGHGSLSLAGGDSGIVDQDESAGGMAFDATQDQINLAFLQGVTYTVPEGGQEGLTDTVTVTVTDAHGASDNINFRFSVFGEEGATLTGADGKDMLFGTGNDDTFTGGDGADVFVFANEYGGPEVGFHSGHDTITDFTPGEDRIALVGYTDPYQQFLLQQQANPDSHVIDFGNGSSITLNVTIGTLQESDFILHSGPVAA